MAWSRITSHPFRFRRMNVAFSEERTAGRNSTPRSLRIGTKDEFTVCQYLRWVCADSDGIVFEKNRSRRVQKTGDSARRERRRRAGSSVIQRKRLVQIIPNLVIVAFGFHPLRIDRCGSEAHSDDLDTQCIKVGLEVAVPATLGRSARRPGERKEPHHRGFPHQVGFRSRTTIVILSDELRGRDRVLWKLPK